MLRASTSRRERIIAFGESGSGKSSIYVSIASYMELTRSTDHIELFDSNKAWDSISDPGLEKFVRVTKADVEDFGTWKNKMKMIVGRVKPDDWIVVDLMSEAWDGAQKHYWGQKRGNDSLADLWLQMKPEEVSGDHGTNWGIINKFYGEFRSLVLNASCHVLMLAGARDLRQPGKSGSGGDDIDTRSFYGSIGSKMEGQKELRGDGNTVLFCQRTPREYIYTTVKENGPIGRPKRASLLAKEVTAEKGFVGTYLIPVAGWKI